MDPIAQALDLLETAASDSTHPPAMIVLPPDSSRFILGNRDGFIRLAAASLKAAQGEEQSFKGQPWVHTEELDWRIDGLKPDPSAHIYLPTRFTRFQEMRQKVLGILVFLLVVLCLLVGLGTIIKWIFF